MKKIIVISLWLIGIFCNQPLFAESSDIAVGAIRWDAWYGEEVNNSHAGYHVQKALEDEKWLYRVPARHRRLPNGEIVFECATEESMEEELHLAHDAGIKFWAYCVYAPQGRTLGLSRALSQHMKSPNRKLVPLCAILENTYLSKPQNDRVLEMIRNDAYFKINGRPVIFTYVMNTKFDTMDKPLVKKSKEEFFSKVREICGADPINITMHRKPEKDGKRFADFFNADAISTYWEVRFNLKAGEFSELANLNREWWKRAANTGHKVVPIVTAGVDRRPRIFHPMPWEAHVQKKGVGAEFYIKTPSPEEIAELVNDAIKFVQKNPTVCPHKLVLIYAWNEHDEGGWLAPTAIGGTKRLDAIKKILKKD